MQNEQIRPIILKKKERRKYFKLLYSIITMYFKIEDNPLKNDLCDMYDRYPASKKIMCADL